MNSLAFSHICLEQEFLDNERTSSFGPGLGEWEGRRVPLPSAWLMSSARKPRVGEATEWLGDSRDGRALERGGERPRR